MGGQDAHPTRRKKYTLCGTGILPVLENGTLGVSNNDRPAKPVNSIVQSKI